MLGYKYLTVRMRPSMVRDEYANIGVILFNPEQEYLDIMCQPQLTSRLHAFFPDVARKNYKELVEDLVESVRYKWESAQVRFNSFSRMLEGFICMSNVKYAISEKQPAEMLLELFEENVGPAAMQQAGRHQEIEQKIAQLFREKPWFRQYKKKTYTGTRGYTLSLRYVAETQKCVWPLDLNYDRIGKAMDDALLITNRVERFLDQLPERIIFPYRLDITDIDILETGKELLSNIQKLEPSRIIVTTLDDSPVLEQKMAM